MQRRSVSKQRDRAWRGLRRGLFAAVGGGTSPQMRCDAWKPSRYYPEREKPGKPGEWTDPDGPARLASMIPNGG
jgi:hypothetical protein